MRHFINLPPPELSKLSAGSEETNGPIPHFLVNSSYPGPLKRALRSPDLMTW